MKETGLRLASAFDQIWVLIDLFVEKLNLYGTYVKAARVLGYVIHCGRFVTLLSPSSVTRGSINCVTLWNHSVSSSTRVLRKWKKRKNDEPKFLWLKSWCDDLWELRVFINSPCSRAPVYDYPLGRLAFFSSILSAAGPTEEP